MSEITPAPDVPQPPSPPASFRLPAEYYAASPHEIKPLFPRWVPLGCGTAAAVILLLAFGGGAFVARVGIGPLMEKLIGSMENEIPPMYAKDVTPAQRAALEAEFTQLRENIRSEKISIARLDPLMSTMREATADRQVTSAEVVKLTQAIHELNASVGTTHAPQSIPPRH